MTDSTSPVPPPGSAEAPVRPSRPGKRGFINRSGRVVIPIDWIDASTFHGGRAAVCTGGVIKPNPLFGGREVPFYGWHYPPFFFAIAVLVAAVPYAWGLAIWLVTSFTAYLAAIRAILGAGHELGTTEGDVQALTGLRAPRASAAERCDTARPRCW